MSVVLRRAADGFFADVSPGSPIALGSTPIPHMSRETLAPYFSRCRQGPIKFPLSPLFLMGGMGKESARDQALDPLHDRRKPVMRLSKQVITIVWIVSMTGLSHLTMRGTLDRFDAGGWSAIRAVQGPAQVGAAEVKRIQGLLQGNEVLGAPTALQALGNLVLAGADARVPELGQSQAIALTGDDGAQDRLPRLASHVGDHVDQLDVYRGQGLLYVRHEAAQAAQQHGALAAERAQHADLLGRAEGTVQQTKAHELLQPLAVQHIALAAGDVLDMADVDRQHGEAARFEQFVQGIQ
nr:hypothetical protein [Hydrogenophaga sp.]